MTQKALELRKRADKRSDDGIERGEAGKLVAGSYPLGVVDVVALQKNAAFSTHYVGVESQLGWLELIKPRVRAQEWRTQNGQPGRWEGIHADQVVLHTRYGDVTYDIVENPGRVEDPEHPAGYRLEHQYSCVLAKAPKKLKPVRHEPTRVVEAADFAFNISLGRFIHYSTLPAASDALIIWLLKSAGVQADATLRDHDELAALLAAANDEADFTNYARKSITSVTVTVDDTNERVDADFADQTWTSAGGAANNTISDLEIGYDGDTGAGTDANISPMTNHDFSVTTDGSDLTAQIATAGFGRAQ